MNLLIIIVFHLNLKKYTFCLYFSMWHKWVNLTVHFIFSENWFQILINKCLNQKGQTARDKYLDLFRVSDRSKVYTILDSEFIRINNSHFDGLSERRYSTLK